MPAQKPPNEHDDHHHRPQKFPQRTKPYVRIPIANFEGSRCHRIGDSWPVDDPDADRQLLFDDLIAVNEFLNAVAPVDSTTQELLRRLYATEEISAADIARLIDRHRSTVGHWIANVKSQFQAAANTRPDLLEKLPQRFRHLVTGSELPRNGKPNGEG